MDTKEKYGIRNRQAILLFAQMILIKVGLIIQIFVLIFSIMHNLSPFMIASSVAMIIAHIAAVIYGYLGYKKGKVFYQLTIGMFLTAILVNIILPFRDIPQKVLLTLLFGLMSIFPFIQADYKRANILIFIAAVIALGFSIYSCITANPDSMGETGSGFPTIIMYLSIFAPVVLVGLFGAAFNAKHERFENGKQFIKS